MTSVKAQIALALEVRTARSLLDTEVRDRATAVVRGYASGDMTYLEARTAVNNLVQGAYVASQSLGRELISKQADLNGWMPKIKNSKSTYLKSLMADARIALQDLRASDKGDKAVRNASMRIGHSAGVASQRGNTDALIDGAQELIQEGVFVEKMWVASFSGNTPCMDCTNLHGTSVPLMESFPTTGKTKVYRDLLGPPRHPRCKCTLVTVVRVLDNALEEITGLTSEEETDTTPRDDTLSTEDVKKMKPKVFSSVIGALKKIWKSLLRR